MMFKYKLAIKNLTSTNAEALPPEKQQMLSGMMTFLSVGLKAMPGVTNVTVQEDHTLLIESTEDLDLKFRAMGNQVLVSKVS